MLDAVNEYILPLKGHKAARVCSVEEKLRREHLGV